MRSDNAVVWRKSDVAVEPKMEIDVTQTGKLQSIRGEIQANNRYRGSARPDQGVVTLVNGLDRPKPGILGQT